jgi:hypothetical protein
MIPKMVTLETATKAVHKTDILSRGRLSEEGNLRSRIGWSRLKSARVDFLKLWVGPAHP